MNYKSKVFLSSTQLGNEFEKERELISFLFKKEPLSSIFDLWKVENQAAGIPIEDEYIRNVKQSAIVILLVDSVIRDAVKKEIEEAKKSSIPIFVFIRENSLRSAEALNYIESIRPFVTTTDYKTLEELFEKI